MLVLLLSLVGLAAFAPITTNEGAARPISQLLTEGGTPVSGESIVIEAIDETNPATPSGDQTLRIAVREKTWSRSTQRWRVISPRRSWCDRSFRG